jgi:hypothetical protein
MILKYQKFFIEIEFEEELYFSVYPTFLFRSLLGKELRNLSCLFKDRKCEDCDLKYQCAYSKLFETPIPKDSNTLNGRNFAPHPIILFCNAKYKEKNSKAILEVILIGDAINYLPYVFYAFKKAGEIGIEKNRVKYQIKDVFTKNMSILRENQINTDFEIENWSFPSEIGELQTNKKIINFVTPLRLKIEGKFSSDFEYLDLLKSALRRFEVLKEMYGEVENKSYNINNITQKIQKKNFHWLELYHHSSRQKNGMKLGGIVGSLIIEGEFSELEISLLNFMELFNIGKNISFGLGRVEVL